MYSFMKLWGSALHMLFLQGLREHHGAPLPRGLIMGVLNRQVVEHGERAARQVALTSVSRRGQPSEGPTQAS